MSVFYDRLDAKTKGAWVVHHGQKTSSTMNAAAEFPALDAAGKAATLLSQLSASDQNTVSADQVSGYATASGLNPRIELPALLAILENHKLIDRSSSGDIEVLGLTSASTVQHASEIFEEQRPTPEERATVALAELASAAPVTGARTLQFISDEFQLKSSRAEEFLGRSEIIGFVDAEGALADKLYFNGNIFRRDDIAKVERVLSHLSADESRRVMELNEKLDALGCLQILTAEQILGLPLFEKVRAAGMYDINLVANLSGEHGFITRPSAFHKYNDPLADDAFDLAKALVAALTFGMTQSAAGRGRIGSVGALLRSLISGQSVGPATAIGEDYRVLETRGVLRLTKAKTYGFTMRLLKKDIGEMALRVLTTGESSSSNAVLSPFPGKMSGYVGPEAARANFRKTQLPPSRKMTEDVLQALRTKGSI